MLVLVAPGQGAQTPGFLAPWLDLTEVADRVGWWSAVTGLDLVRLGTTADADVIRDTAVAQPLLVAGALASASALFAHPSDIWQSGCVVAGHSVGEFAAAALAGSVCAESALVLVRERGRAMAAAAASGPTGMSAVLGGVPDEVTAKLAEHGLTPANLNGPGQVVAAGTLEQLAALGADPPPRARVRPLPVAGAFHTEHMAPAVDTLRALTPGVPARDPRTRLLSNADGAIVRNGRDLLDQLVRQVAQPVRWDLCQDTMTDLGVTAMIELAPGGTLTGLARRALPGVESVALKTPDDLPAARELIARHRPAITQTDAPSWRIVVAPLGGTFHKRQAEVGEMLAPGAPIGVLVTRRQEQPVAAAYGGTIVEWLVSEGDPVSPGQPLVRLHPQEVAA